MHELELEKAFGETTPRVAAIVLLCFDDLIGSYERKHGYRLSHEEKGIVRWTLRCVLARECRP